MAIRGNRLWKLKKWGFVGYDAVTSEYFVLKEETKNITTHGA
jgi:hypothetical protein